jgi:BlaI family transcriptional regulator, penicillinase repressor
MPQRRGIGQAELEILNYIHDHHPVTVRQVADHVAATKGHTRTTVLNVMTRLVNKGYLTRRRTPGGAEVRGVYAYAPRVPKADLLRTLVGDFVSRALGGSLSPFVAYLAQDARLTESDVADLRRLLSELESRPAESRRAKGGAK